MSQRWQSKGVNYPSTPFSTHRYYGGWRIVQRYGHILAVDSVHDIDASRNGQHRKQFLCSKTINQFQDEKSKKNSKNTKHKIHIFCSEILPICVVKMCVLCAFINKDLFTKSEQLLFYIQIYVHLLNASIYKIYIFNIE